MRSPTEPSLRTEENWIEHLHEWATMLTPDAHTAADLAMECLYAFYRHFQHFPWQHPDPHHALCWCRHKLRSLTIDRTRHEQCLVQVAWETLPEGVACAAMDERLQNEFDAQAFLDSLPEGLREVLQLRLEGYSWEEVGRLLGRNANTLRSYLPDLRKKFIEFFGYDPSKRASESFIRVEAANASEDGGRDDEGTSGTEKGFTHDTESAGVYGGVVNLGNGNLTLQVPFGTGGLPFVLIFNSQASSSPTSPIAPKWTHNWNVFLVLNSNQTQAVLYEGDGSRWVFTDPDGDGIFSAPRGRFEQLERLTDGRYQLSHHSNDARWLFSSTGTTRWLEAIEDIYGRKTELVYTNGRLSGVVDRYGRTMSLTYDPNGRLWKVSDFSGREWEFVYFNNRLERVRFPVVTDENAQPRQYEIVWGYNSRGNVSSWTDRLGQVWQYGYLSGTSDALKWFRDPSGNQWTATYSVVVAEGNDSTSSAESGVSRWTDPTGVWVEYGFASPVVVRTTRGGNNTTARLTTRLWYNGQYQVVKRQDPAGLVWEWQYDPDGKLLWSKKPNGATTTYTYYAGTDRLWRTTDALGNVWEYTYTDYGDVKSVKDPEGAISQYVYDYELGEPAYGQVRKMIDPLGRETESKYYSASDPNLARRGQVQEVVVPGGYWRRMDYGGAGWLVRREVQVASGSEETTYTYDSWGRLRGIDYPRSADVSMGWDGENRRVWVQDGAGRRDYTYDAWARVRQQRGCCGDGIEVVAVSAEYDKAGRKRFERELNASNQAIRTIETTYDALGRVQTIGDYRGQVVYEYDLSSGRLKKEYYPNGSYVEHTYYGLDNPSQRGNVWKVEHKRLADNSLLIGYEYTYDLLGRVEQSVERPSGDTTIYTYTPAGRLHTEERTGQVAYSRSYEYNLDGSRSEVVRDDALNGSHWELYIYDEVSGRLESVLDLQTGEVNEFEWNSEGTLARWDAPSVAYARVFGYDEEGRLTKIERDYGNGSLQLAYEYGYNSDGVRVWKQDVLGQQEYRYICRSGCGGIPMRVYNRAIGGTSWRSKYCILLTFSEILYNDEVSRGWLSGTQIFRIEEDTSLEFHYKDRFGNPVIAFIYPLNRQRAEWLEDRSVFPYAHAWIEFDPGCETLNGRPQKGWGFYPGTGGAGSSSVGGGQGSVQDDTGRRGVVVGWIDDPICVKALCECVRQSAQNPPNYCFPSYVCGSWVVDMIACAEQRAGKQCLQKPKSDPPPPPLPPHRPFPQPTGPCGGQPCP